MRRSTLGAMSPSQLNRRASGSIGATRVLGKQSRLSNVFPMAVAGALNRQQLGGPLPPQPSNLPRRSSIHGKAATSQQQPHHVDSRPFNEKSFQHDCIRKLTAYLTTHGYNVAISTKLLAAPSSKEVLNIVQFLFRQLDPGFKFAAKLEEDVPMMFKRVGYPSQISKSALYAAGSPHTWPGLLAALAWLVDLLVYQEKKETADSESAPFDDNGLKLQLEYFSRSYDCYLNGDDDECERLDTIFKQQFEDIKVQLDDKKQKLESLVTEVQNKLQALKKEPSALMMQQSKKAVYLSDITKFDHINSNLQCGLQAAEKKQEERKQELLAMKMERETILAEIEELRQKIAVQHLNSIDVERMRKEKEVMETNLHQVQNRVHELHEAALDNEVQASIKLKELQQIAVDFTKQANKWKLNFGEANLDQGGQFQLMLNSEAGAPYDILGGSLKGVVKPFIRGLMESSKRLTNEERDERFVLMQGVHAAEVACQEKIEQIEKCRVLHRKLEQQHDACKDDLNNALASKIASREALKSSMAEKERNLRKSESESEELFKQWDSKYQMGIESCKLDLAAKKSEWADMVTMILNTKQKTDTLLESLAKFAAQSVESVKQQLCP